MILKWRLGVCLVLLNVAVCPAASILDTSGGGSASNGFLQYSGGDALYGDPSLTSVITGFGQTFRVSPEANSVTSVTVWLDNNDPWENVVNFRTGQRWNDPAEMYAYIAEWDSSKGALMSGQTAGAEVLYQSSYQEVSSSGLASYSFSIGGQDGLQLDPNKQYVALFTGVSPNGSAFDGSLGFAKVLGGANGESNNESAVFFPRWLGIFFQRSDAVGAIHVRFTGHCHLYRWDCFWCHSA